MDLGNCGLDFLPNELFDKFFTKTLKGLSLGLFYFNEMNNLVGSENSDRVNYLNEHELGKLSKLKNLQRFFFNVSQNSDNRISSMSFVSGLMRLNYLSLTGNKIYKIEGLDENLQTLDISNNQISKIEGLNENLHIL